jgi:bifunctional non-homologous end joining protein LigD
LSAAALSPPATVLALGNDPLELGVAEGVVLRPHREALVVGIEAWPAGDGQMGTIEFHGWGSRADAVETPERMVFDLDPDEALEFAAVKQAAQDLRRELEGLGLTSFAMLSGGKGIHVVVPLSPGHDWEAHKDFSKRFAEALSLAEPERFVATMSKAKRKGRIFIDYLRNQRGSTAVMPYSARARPGAPVAAPISWAELDGLESAGRWTIGDLEELVARAESKALRGRGFAAQLLPGG